MGFCGGTSPLPSSYRLLKLIGASKFGFWESSVALPLRPCCVTFGKFSIGLTCCGRQLLAVSVIYFSYSGLLSIMASFPVFKLTGFYSGSSFY